MELLRNHVFGNPHSTNPTSQGSTELVETTRRRVLEFFNGSADEYGVNIILETHQTTVLNSAQAIRRVIERSDSDRVKVNVDPANFITDLQTAFNPAPVINELFDVLEPYIDTVHVKDFYLEDRFIVHISETVVGTGIMDLATVLRRAQAANPDGYVVIEHLPVNLIPLAKRNLDQLIEALGLPVG